MIIRIKEWICKCYIKDIKKCNIEKQHWENKYNNLIKDYSDMNYDYGLKIKELKSDIKSKSNIIIDLQSQLSDYTKDDKHLTLETFMDWLKENVKPVSRTHRTSGRVGNRVFHNSNVRPHIFFTITDEEKVMTFAEKVLYWTSFTNEDDLVYKFNIRFDNLYPTSQYYKTDQQLYGVIDYWAGAEITIDKIEKEGTYGDCEDVMILKYCCLKLLLNKYFPNWDKNRLRGFLAWVMGAYYHAVLCWVKEGINDWIPIETTYYNQRFRDVWVNNKRLRNNEIAYKINFSFDDEAEYEKI